MALPTRPRCLVCTNARKSRGLCAKHYMQLRSVGYDVTKAEWYDRVKDSAPAMALLKGRETDTNPVAATSAVQTAPTQKEHDAWVAAYAHAQLKGESLDTLLNRLVVRWYEETFPALAQGQVSGPVAVQHA